MSALPDRLGEYFVVQEIGRGSMGTVYSAYDAKADRDVAIKVCSEEQKFCTDNDMVFRKLFMNEANTARLLDHPNIVKILDAGEQSGDPYIVMEYIDGGATLADHCEPSAMLPVEQVAACVATCAKALNYAHDRGIIHRDIKPSNIMLSRSGEVKIGDFSIAERLVSDTTRVVGVFGSPKYMSPEQIQERELGPATDLYSLGVVLFELLAGRVPFPTKTLSSLVHKIIHERPPSVREYRPELPQELDSIVGRALQKAPEHRYASGNDFANDLARIFPAIAAQSGSLDLDGKFEQVRALAFFSEFSDVELWDVARAGVWERYAAGEPVLLDKKHGFTFYIVISGSVAVKQQGKPGVVLQRTDCFGSIGSEPDSMPQGSMEASTPAVLLRIDEEPLERASIGAQLRFNKAFLRAVLGRLAKSARASGDVVGIWRNDVGSAV